MSDTLDRKVVEMQLDNSNFESNANTSLNTIEKLKSALDFSGSSRGLEDINAAFEDTTVSANAVGVALDIVSSSFDALGSIATTVLSNITTKLTEVAESTLSSLTVDNVADGWNKYNEMIQSSQTIMKATGEDIEYVEEQLERLLWFTDETSYSFTDMTDNIAKFTAQGQDLEASVTAMEGISVWAALSGGTINEASRAMYNLSQSLSMGAVKLVDWKSIENANMATKEFKETAIQAALEVGTLYEAADGLIYTMAGDTLVDATTFRETLSDEWFTSEVLMDTLSLYGSFADALNDVCTATGTYATEMLGYLSDYEEGILDIEEAADACGVSADELTEMLEYLSAEDFALGEKGFRTAQEAKTLTEALNATKDAASSAIMTIFESVIGNYEQATKVWTDFCETLYSVFVDPIYAIADIIEGAMDSPFGAVIERIEEVTSCVETVTAALTDYSEIVDAVISGEYGTGQSRWDQLTEEGYDWAYVQNLVNEKLGYSTRYATDYAEATEEVADAAAVTIEELTKMSDAELENLGFTEDEIEAFKLLGKYADQTGLSIEEIIEDVDSLSGRTLLFDGIRNVGNAILSIFNAIGEAWTNVFPPGSGEKIYAIIAGFHKLSIILTPSEQLLEKITRTFTGLFSILDIIKRVIGGTITRIFKMITSVLGGLHINVFGVTAVIGDALTSFHDWLVVSGRLDKVLDKLAECIHKLASKIKTLVNNFLKIPGVEKIVEKIKYAIEYLKKLDYSDVWSKVGSYAKAAWNVLKAIAQTLQGLIDAFLQLPIIVAAIEKLKGGFDYLASIDFSQIGKNLMDGLRNGITDNMSGIPKLLVTLGYNILEAIRNVLGIHSPSVKAYEVAVNFIQGFINGIRDSYDKLIETFSELGSKIIETVKGFDWTKIIYAVSTSTVIKLVGQITKTVANVTAPLEDLGDLLEGVGKLLKSVGSSIKNFGKAAKYKAMGEAIKSVGIGIAILVASLVVLAYMINENGVDSLWQAVVILGALVGILIVLMLVLENMSSTSISISKNAVTVASVIPTIIAVVVSILVLAVVLKILGSMEPEQLVTGMKAMATICLTLLSVMVILSALGKFAKDGVKSIQSLSAFVIKLAAAMLLLAIVVKIIGSMDKTELAKGIAFIVAMSAIFAGFMLLAKFCKNSAALEVTGLLSMAVFLVVAALVVKMLGAMEIGALKQGIIAVGILCILVVLLIKAITISSKNAVETLSATTTLLGISLMLIAMAVVVKLLGSMSVTQLAKGLAAVTVFLVLIGVLLVLISVLEDSQAKILKQIATLLAISIMIGVMAAVMLIIGVLDPKKVATGLVCITVLSLLVMGILYMSKHVKDGYKTVLMLAILFGVMAAMLIILAKMDPERVKNATVCVSVIIGMLALLVASTALVKKSTSSMILLGVLLAMLCATIIVLAKMDPSNILSICEGLSLAILSLATSVAVLSVVNFTGALKGVAALAIFITALLTILVIIGAIFKNKNLENLTAGGNVLIKLGEIIGSFITAVISGGITKASSVLPIVGNDLADFMSSVSTFLEGAESLSGRGTSILKGVGTLVGVIVAMSVADVVAGISNILSLGTNLGTVGSRLAEFWVKCSPFILGMKLVDTDALAGVVNLVKCIRKITKGNIFSFAKSATVGKGNMNQFKKQLSEFAEAIVEFSKIVSGKVDSDAVDAAASAGLAVAALYDALPSNGGLVQKIIGTKTDLTSFGEQLAAFGLAITKFSVAVSGKINLDAVNDASEAGIAIAELYDYLPKTDGWAQKIFGECNLQTFATQLKAFGEAIVTFSDTVEGHGITSDTADAAVAAGEAVAGLYDCIPRSNGWIQSIFGTKSLSTFATQMGDFGDAIVKFSTSVGDGLDSDVVKAAANAGLTISELYNNLPEDKGVFQEIKEIFTGGSINFKELGTYMGQFGEAISDMMDTLPENIDTNLLFNVANAASIIVDILKLLSTTSWSDLSDFVSVTNDFIESINSFSTLDIESMKEAIDTVSELASSVDGSTTFSEVLDNLTTTITSVIGAITSYLSGAAEDINLSARTAFTGIISGLEFKRKAILDKVEYVCSKAADKVKEIKSDFKENGKYLGEGLIEGIKAKYQEVYNAAYAMGQQAVQGEKDGQASASPSKLTFQSGLWFGEGLVNGIVAMYSAVRNAAYTMGDNAVGIIGNAIAAIADYIDSDIDTTFTITPVLDLSEAESGVGVLSKMLSSNPTMMLATNLGTIGPTLTEIQNGQNSNITAALNALGKKLENQPGNIYNIDGVTYDDGSNVASAVKDIVRAARVERRT